MAERLQISLFGSPGLTLGGKLVSGFVSCKAQALIFYLAATGQSHTRIALAGLLWSEVPDQTARNNLRDVLYNLRQLISPYLLITRHAVSLNPESAFTVDSQQFLAYLSDSYQAGTPSNQEMEALHKATCLYKGEFLAGFYVRGAPLFEAWVLEERQFLGQKFINALERLVSGYVANGDFKSAIGIAQRWLSIDPINETAHRNLMQLYAWDGDRATSLRQYQQCEKILAQELGVNPAHETTALYEHIRAGELHPEILKPKEQLIRSYVLHELIGQGNFGAVYRAYQPQVDRQVAIKVILPRYANMPDFIRRFEHEAQLVAHLEHPHIVPLYDYWREPDSAYLVMRWFPRGNLQDSIVNDIWTLKVIQQLLDQIAAALASAHRQGVVHQNIKPTNILLDEDQNAYLADFGIARGKAVLDDLYQGDALRASNLAFISPEQIRGEPVTPQTDIYSLGLVLFQLLTGKQPFLNEQNERFIEKILNKTLPKASLLRPELPPALDEVLQKATAKQACQRFSNVQELALRFRQALSAEISASPEIIAVTQIEPANPYKGLRPFQEADASDFFGREALVEQLLASLVRQRFLAVIGPSGSGKSSLVTAGLIPALRRGALPGSENWFIIKMQPGVHPFETLESKFRGIAIRPLEPSRYLRPDGGNELSQAVNDLLPNDRSELLLFIDQFEELFSLVAEPERAQFLRALSAAVSDSHSRLRVIVTLGADFYDQPLNYADFGELVRNYTEVILPLSPSELERVITAPTARVGVGLESGLLGEIVIGVIEQPGALPQLQYALTELFAHRSGNTLTLETYHAIGGVFGALGKRAEELYGSLDSEGQAAVRQLFLHLVTLGERTGSGSSTAYTCRRAPIAEFLAITEGDRVNDIIERFGRYRLLTFNRDPDTRAPTVEIAHESLLREWKRLSDWLEASREDIRTHRRLAEAANDWLVANRDKGFLLQGSRLNQLEAWMPDTDVALTQLEQDYLAASLALRQQRLEQEAARQKHEREIELRSMNRLRMLVFVLVVATLIALGLSLFALNQRTQAQRHARIAAERELASASIANLDIDPQRSILLALQAAEPSYAVDGSILPEVIDALHRGIQASRLLYTLPESGRGVFSPDGKLLATGGPVVGDASGDVKIWDAGSGELLHTLSGHTQRVILLVFSPDGNRLATSSDDGSVKLWNMSSCSEIFTFGSPADRPVGLAFSPDGKRLAVTSPPRTVIVWDTTSGERLMTLEDPGVQGGIAFSPDGTWLATDSETGMVKIREADTGSLKHILKHNDGVCDVIFSPDGAQLATVSLDGTAKIWDVANEVLRVTFFGHTGWICGVDFSPDGNRIATGGEDGTARIWDAATGQQLILLAGHTQGIDNVAFSPDGTRLTTASADRTAKVWDVSPQGSRDWMTLTAKKKEVIVGMAFSPDGDTIATVSLDGPTRLWDTQTGEVLLKLTGNLGWSIPAFHPQGRFMATGSDEMTARIWDLKTGTELYSLKGHLGMVNATAFSPDGQRLATACGDGTIKIWDTSGLSAKTVKPVEELFTLNEHTDEIYDVAFSPDGKTLASASWDATASLWDMDSGELISVLQAPAPLSSVVYKPDGSQIAFGCTDGTAILWEPQTGKKPQFLVGHSGIVWDIDYSPDGRQIATGSMDGTAKIWDPSSRKELYTLTGHSSLIGSISFSPDGEYLATTGADGTVRIYVMDVNDLIELARQRVTRSLTTVECRQYLHVDYCP